MNRKGPKLGATIYSYAYDLRLGTMSVEDCIADIADMGGTGIEILGESHVRNFPNPSDVWVDKWFESLDRYKVVPTAFDGFLDTALYPGRLLTIEEAVAHIERDLKLADRLGFRIMRTISPPYPPDNPADIIHAPYAVSSQAMRVLEQALPIAERYNVTIGVELHSPVKLKSPYVDRIMDLIHRTGSKHIGFVPDMSAFVRRPPRNEEAQLVERGAREHMLRFIADSYLEGHGPERTCEEAARLGGNAIEMTWAGVAGIYHFSNNDPAHLSDLAGHLIHCHAKFYEITDDFEEYSIPYREVMQALIAAGFDGYFSSEYEGRRSDLQTSNQIRMHHIMLRRLWDEIFPVGSQVAGQIKAGPIA